MKIVIEYESDQMPTITNYSELMSENVNPTIVLGILKQISNQVEYLEMEQFAKAITRINKKQDGE